MKKKGSIKLYFEISLFGSLSEFFKNITFGGKIRESKEDSY